MNPLPTRNPCGFCSTGCNFLITVVIGGLGGFILPLIFGNIRASTDSYQGGFILLGALALCCLAITYFQYRRTGASDSSL